MRTFSTITCICFILVFLPNVIFGQVEENNLFSNYQFDDGETGWQFVQDGSVVATHMIDEENVLSGPYCLRWEIEDGGAELYYIQTYQQAPIEDQVEYFLDFLVYYEPNGTDPLNVNVSWELAGDPYTRYWDSQTIELDTPYVPIRIQRNFIAQVADGEDPSANCKIFFGQNNDVFVYLDRVYLGEYPLDDLTGTGDQTKQAPIPVSFNLQQNYPNPFNPSTQVLYSLGEQAQVSLQVYNQLGQLVNTLREGSQAGGTYTVQWNGLDQYGKDVSSGVYIIKMQATARSQVFTDFIKAIKLK